MKGSRSRPLRLVLTALLLLALPLSGCGTEEWDSLFGETKDERRDESTPPTIGESVDVDVEIRDYESFSFSLSASPLTPSFALAAASRLVVNLRDCASGHSVTAHDTSISGGALPVFTGDRGCVAELVEFDLDGQTFTPDSGSPFSGKGAAFFSNAGQTVSLEVYEFYNLSDPVVSTDIISFGMRAIASGSDFQLMSLRALQGYNGSAENMPNFRFYGFPEVTGLSGNQSESPVFRIRLECIEPVTGTAPNLACPSGGQDLLMTNLRYLLEVHDKVADWDYPNAASVRDVIRTSNGIPTGVVVGNAGAVLAAETLPEEEGGFNGGFEITVVSPSNVYLSPGNNKSAFRLFALILTSNPDTSQTLYGHSALRFSLSE